MKLKFTIICIVFLVTIFAPAKGQVQISANKTAQQLAQKLAGNGITISNATLQCHNNANGFFNINTNILPIDSGVVLSTGKVIDIASGENGATSSNNNTAGDPALQSLSGASITYDACVLEFDMIPQGNQIAFDYIFGSEEYINSVCGPYNDAFAFFISGPGIAGTMNMAKVPNTNIPVTVNSVNNGIPGAQANGSAAKCTSMGPGAPFTQYYNDNTGGNQLAYRGFTSVFTAQADVIPCQPYHLKLTIADAQNRLYDSGVFIKAGSLKSQPVQINVNGSFVYQQQQAIYYTCDPGSITFTTTQTLPTALNLSIITSGNAVAGIDYVVLPSNVTIPANSNSVTIPIQSLAGSNQIKNLNIAVLDPFQCTANAIVDSGTIYLLPIPKFDILTKDTSLCFGNKLNLAIQNIDSFDILWTPNSGVTYANGFYTIQVNQHTKFFATATTKYGNCAPQIDSIEIEAKPGPLSVTMEDSIVICSNANIKVDPTVYPANIFYQYSWSGPNGYSSTNAILQMNANNLSNGWYYLTVTQQDCGSIIDSVYLEKGKAYAPPKIDASFNLCTNDSLYITTEGEHIVFYDDQWSMNGIDKGFWFSTPNAGTFTFYVSQGAGTCISNKEKFNINVVRCCENELFVPSAFSPNNDGKNDEFRIPADFTTTIKEIIIFNRWGEVVYKHIGNSPKWDGNHKGNYAEVGTYFYILKYQCNDQNVKIKKGEINLIR